MQQPCVSNAPYKYSPSTTCWYFILYFEATMSTSKKKKQKPIIHRNLPASPSTTVRTREFKRLPGSRLVSTTTTSSSRSSTPLHPQLSHGRSDEPSESQFYSDVDEETQESVRKKDRKGPSRSVNVSAFDLSLLRALLTQRIDVVGPVDSTQGRTPG